ncbi:MAG: hypothetical protein ABH871_09395 [Pseudomonadota bacterium]
MSTFWNNTINNIGRLAHLSVEADMGTTAPDKDLLTTDFFNRPNRRSMGFEIKLFADVDHFDNLVELRRIAAQYDTLVASDYDFFVFRHIITALQKMSEDRDCTYPMILESAELMCSGYGFLPIVWRTAILLSAYRKRLKNEPGKLSEIDLIIDTIFHCTQTQMSWFFDVLKKQVRPLSAEEETSIQGSFFDEFDRAITCPEGKETPIHIELGGGGVPYGLRLAEEMPRARVISIDPMPKQLAPPLLRTVQRYVNHFQQDNYRKYHLMNKGEIEKPANFVELAGYAEWMALALAKKPVADSLAIVSPNPNILPSMLLSACLAVKPGGKILVCMLPHDRIPNAMLSVSGLTIEDKVELKPGNKSRPLSPMADLNSRVLPMFATVFGVNNALCASTMLAMPPVAVV